MATDPASEFIRNHTLPDHDAHDGCPICFEAFTTVVALRITNISGCNHVFCATCIRTMINSDSGEQKKCPLCRAQWKPADSESEADAPDPQLVLHHPLSDLPEPGPVRPSVPAEPTANNRPVTVYSHTWDLPLARNDYQPRPAPQELQHRTESSGPENKNSDTARQGRHDPQGHMLEVYRRLMQSEEQMERVMETMRQQAKEIEELRRQIAELRRRMEQREGV